MSTILEGTSVRFKIVSGLGGMKDSNGNPANVMLVGLDKVKIGKIIPSGTIGRNGKLLSQSRLVTPPNLKNLLDSYRGEDYMVPEEIYKAIENVAKMAVQASY